MEHIGQLGGNLGIHVVLDFDHIKEGVVLDDGQLLCQRLRGWR